MMTPRTKGIGTSVIVIVVVVVMMTATIAFIALTSTSPTMLIPTTSLTSSAGPSVTYSNISASGLQLQVALNSSSIQPKGEAAVQIELLNTVSHNVTLGVVPNQSISSWNGDDFFCGANPSDNLVGFALFSGHFSAENVSAVGSPLQLAAPAAVPCPFRLGLNETTFLPNSDKMISSSYDGQTQEPSYPVTAEANATTGYCITSASSSVCSPGSGILGYWNPGFGYTRNLTFASNYFTYLPTGEYTIVAVDDWNQTVYAHFQVALSVSNSSSVNYATAVTNSTNNLQLQLYLNTSSSSASGVTVSAAVDEYNTLAYTNNVTVANQWPLALNGLNGPPCWPGNYPVGLAIAEGYYTSSNITASKFLDLTNPGATYACPAEFASIAGYLFQPTNDTAAIYGSYGTGPYPTEKISVEVMGGGYWSQNGVLTTFPRGVYTVVAEDEWGNLALAYFTIS
jgi:hypothetical protein